MYLIDGAAVARGLARWTPRICSVVHVIAAAVTLAWIRGGSEAEPDPAARATYIASHTVTWRAAWFVWMVAAISLAGFFCWWAARSPKRRLARTALVIGFAGIVVDVFADALFIMLLPEHYDAYATFVTLTSQAGANGLYSIAGAVLMLASAPMRSWFRAWGWIVWFAGFALAAAGAMRWDTAIVASAGLLMIAFIPWVWLANSQFDKPL
jgi:hypothetical protein